MLADCVATGIELDGVATGNRFHDPETAELERHIEEAKARMDLAANLGAPRVRVFGNNFSEGASRDGTVSQVAEALSELAGHGVDRGVRPCLELHGEFDWRACQAVGEQVRHQKFGLVWNSVPQDIVDGSVERSLDAVWPWLNHVHLHDLTGQGYPYRELFRLLCDREYDGYMSAEVERKEDKPVGDLWMFVAYYADLFRAYVALGRR